MQKLSQARSELRLAAGSSDKGIQKLQFLKVLSRLDGRGEFSHRLRLAASSSSSFSISTVPSLCKLTRFAGKRLRKCDCDGEERRERGGRRLKEKERRLKIGGGGLLLAVLVFQHRSRYVHIYIYTNNPSAPCIPDVREVKPLAESFLYDVPERLRVGEILWFQREGDRLVYTDYSLNGAISRAFNREFEITRDPIESKLSS